MSRTGVSPTIGGPHFTAPGSSQGDNDSLSDLHGLGATDGDDQAVHPVKKVVKGGGAPAAAKDDAAAQPEAEEKPKQKESSLDALLGIGIDIRISGTIDVYLGRSAPKPSSLQ